MNLEEAIEILNKNYHRGRNNWRVWNVGLEGEQINIVASLDPSLDELTPYELKKGWPFLFFEAIAIAEKYQREVEAAKAESMATKDRCHHYISASMRFRCTLPVLHEGEHVFSQEEFK